MPHVALPPSIAVLVLCLLCSVPARAHPSAPEPEPTAAPDSLRRVMSFNIRLNTPRDSANAWPHRKDRVARIIRTQADLVGVQEALRGMLADLEEHLPGFAWFGAGRDSTGGGEYSAILYRTDRFELLDHGTFWLSETPGVRGSVGWDAALPRIVTWGRFRDRASGRAFVHFNTHFDHRGETARAESARLLRRKVDSLAGALPVVVTGDFNAVPESAPYRLLTEERAGDAPPLTDALTVSAHGHQGPRSTWNGFEEIVPGRRIDFIFVRGDAVRVLRHRILDETFDGGRFPSDHLPVWAMIQFTTTPDAQNPE